MWSLVSNPPGDTVNWMDVAIECAPSYAMAYCHLAMGEAVNVESGAMAAISDGVSAEATTGPGGVIKGVLRKTLGGESFFMAKYRARIHGAWVAVAPHYPGDMQVLNLDEVGPLYAEAGALVASEEGVRLDVRVSGVSAAISTREIGLLSLSGSGKVLLSAYGGLQKLWLEPGQSLTVDTGHLVAFTAKMPMRVAPLTGVVTSVATGEGLVAQLGGPGHVLIQTRSIAQFRDWLGFAEKS